MKIILIDGNNVIHKSSHLKAVFLKDKTAARMSFIEKVKSQLGKSYKIEFYFDGHSDSKSRGIFFSGSKTADELIRKRIEKADSHRNITVVSSDHDITGLAKECGCTVKTSDEFLKNIENSGSVFKDKNINHVIEKESEKPNSVSRKELDFFRDKFC